VAFAFSHKIPMNFLETRKKDDKKISLIGSTCLPRNRQSNGRFHVFFIAQMRKSFFFQSG